MLTNALTVDLEEYFQVEAFTDAVSHDEWPRWESRIEKSTYLLLETFARHGVSATFFTLGWIAERHSDLIRNIAAAGHEIACHGYGHRLIYRQTPDEFRQDLRIAKRVLEDTLGTRLAGYRAPSYSITAASTWALDILIEEGFLYDSSIFPVYHDRYGMPNAKRFIHTIRRPGGAIVELPPSTVAIGPLNLPLAGGGYFRLFPYEVFRRGLRHINNRELQPAVFMVHPWEVDPDQPRVPGTRLNIWRHRLNLGETLGRLESLISDFQFCSIGELLRLEKSTDGVDGSR
jgi:polysaccharide deacetylase family protein (PEP-CTERM system associated)